MPGLKGWLAFFVFALVLGLGAGPGGAARAQPMVPATFYGAVVVNGAAVPDGTEVIAFIDGWDCTQRGTFFRGTAEVNGVSQYSIEVIHESQQEGCGTDGAEVRFEVGGHPADQVAEWRSGPQRLDLTLRLAEGASLPTPAHSAAPQTDEPQPDTVGEDDATPSPGAGSGREGQARNPGAAQGQQENGTQDADSGQPNDTDEGGVALWLIAIVVVLILVGVAAGWIVAGRRHLS